MIVNSQNIEFGYELISVIPYANYLASKGLLEKTISGNDTDCLYFFSPKHEINKEARSWYNTSKVSTPNIAIHKHTLDKSQFLAPDYKDKYANSFFTYDKEIVIICNRHNIEWNTKPINFFDLDTLKALFELLQDKYQVIYINVEGRKELYDNAPPEPFGDFELLKQYPKVINFHDFVDKYNKLSFNTLQLMLFANCQKYITLNGGHAILAAYFGGENFIMSKYGKPQAREITDNVNSYYRWYNEFGGQRCIHVSNEEILLNRIKDSWIDENPIVNILVRTANRPNFFEKCIKSIQKQSYHNINIFVSIDDKSNDYTIKYPVYPIFVNKTNEYHLPDSSVNYGRVMTYNLYFNSMYSRIEKGLIIYLDDDDCYPDEKTIEKIVNEYKKGNELIIWKVKIGNKTIPEPEYFGKEPAVFQISGIGFAFDAKYKNDTIWEEFKRGDFRVAKKLYNIIPNCSHINEILACSQDGAHHGMAIDLKVNKTKNDMEKLIKVTIISNKTKHGKLDLVIGDTIEVSEPKAKQYFIHGIAVPYTENVEYNDETFPTLEMVESLNEIVIPVKKGRKSNKK
jgi:hypothetical protein